MRHEKLLHATGTTLAVLLAVLAIGPPLAAQEQQNEKHLGYAALGGPRSNTLPDIRIYAGTFADGATYLIEVPPHWNGDMFLYSHGYVPPGDPNPPADNGDPLVLYYLVSHGYAVAGSSYAATGWAVQDAFTDQIAVLAKFDELVGQPNRTIAWGHSMGGIITAGLVQKFPERISGALPFCGVLAGSVGFWNEYLDSESTISGSRNRSSLAPKPRPRERPALLWQPLCSTHRAGSIPLHRSPIQTITPPWRKTSSNHCKVFPLRCSLPFVLNWKGGRAGTLPGIPALITKSSSNFLSIMRR